MKVFSTTPLLVAVFLVFCLELGVAQEDVSAEDKLTKLLPVVKVPKPTEEELEKLRLIDESHKKIPKILASLAPEAQMTIYEGLPHPTFDMKQLMDEIANNETALRNGFHFYLPKQVPDRELAEELKNILHDRGSFKPLTRGWGCGGFHPDYSAVFSQGKREVEFQVCLGCRQVRIYAGDEVAYCDASPASYKKLKSLYTRIRMKCPLPAKISDHESTGNDGQQHGVE